MGQRPARRPDPSLLAGQIDGLGWVRMLVVVAIWRTGLNLVGWVRLLRR